MGSPQPPAGVEHDGKLAGGAHVERDLRHLGQGDVCLGDAFVPAQRSATHVDRLEARLLGKPRHDRIERHRCYDKIIAADKITQPLQGTLPWFCE